MRLYSRLNGTATVHHEDGVFEAGDDGSIDVPHELGVSLHGTHINGLPAWETEAERDKRLGREDYDRRQDPATLLAAVERLTERLAPGEPSDGESGEDDSEGNDSDSGESGGEPGKPRGRRRSGTS